MEGGAKKIDDDVERLVEEAMNEHFDKNEGDRALFDSMMKKHGLDTAALARKKKAEGDIWADADLEEDAVAPPPKAKKAPPAAKPRSADAFEIEEVAEDEEGDALPESTGLPVPKHTMKLLPGEDLDDKLQITVELPLVNHIGDVDLEIEPDSLVLGVEETYELRLKLQKEVDEDRVSARFDKAAKKLIITAPVKY